MGNFTVLDDADVAALAAAFALGPVTAWRPIAAGTINSNFAVDAEAGRFFLRVNEGKSEADVRYEADLVADLARRGVATPEPRRGRDDLPYVRHADRFVSAFPWIDGHHLAADAITPAHTAAVGAALARLHLAGADLGPERHRDGIYTYERIRARHAGFRDAADPHLAPAIALLADELAWLDARAADRARLPRGVIHGDLFRDNVLFAGEVLVALIDFEQASTGVFAYDLAVTINDWCWEEIGRGAGRFRRPLVDAAIRGYDSVRRLDPAERAGLTTELRAAALRFTITRITDIYLAGIDKPDKDFRSYLARLQAWREGVVGLG